MQRLGAPVFDWLCCDRFCGIGLSVARACLGSSRGWRIRRGGWRGRHDQRRGSNAKLLVNQRGTSSAFASGERKLLYLTNSGFDILFLSNISDNSRQERAWVATRFLRVSACACPSCPCFFSQHSGSGSGYRRRTSDWDLKGVALGIIRTRDGELAVQHRLVRSWEFF